VLRIEPVEDKWRAFGWHTIRVDGNDLEQLVDAFDECRSVAAADGIPQVIVCDTQIGKGVPMLESREKAHFMRIEEHEWQLCRDELTAGYEAAKGGQR
jgi:transketolase